MSTNFTSILTNVHFIRLCVPVRIAFRSADWKRRHAEVPIRHFIERWEKFSFGYASYPHEYSVALSKLLEAIGKADPRIMYHTEDLVGYQRLLDEHGAVVAAMFAAYASAADRLITPAQAASVSHEAESTWRNRAATGDIPGAWKAGKQWLLPVAVLNTLYDVDVPAFLQFTEPGTDQMPEPAPSEEEAQALLDQLDRGDIDVLNE